MTTNHGYNEPEEGTTNWNVPLNENFRKMDSDIEIRDAASSLDSYEPRDGAKFMATDTGEVYLGDGTAWQQVGSIAQLGGNVFVQESEPSNPSKNDLWIDTSGL